MILGRHIATIAGIVALSVTACSRPAGSDRSSTPWAATPGADATAAVIEEDSLREIIAEIASDEYAGRLPGTDGDRMTRRYLAERLERAGFLPGAADGTYEQRFDLVGLTAEMPLFWSFRKNGDAEHFYWWDDYIAASGMQEEVTWVKKTEVVFVGYGIEAPEEDWDDVKGADLEGKVLLMLNNDPDWSDDLFAGERRLYYGRWTYKYEMAARHGAAGAIIIHTDESAGYPFKVVQTSWSGPQFELPAGDEPRSPVNGWLTYSAAERLVALAGHDLGALIESARSREFRPVPLGVETSLAFTTLTERTETGNVLGLLEGSDPELRDEAVVFTAHHDHLGVGEPDASGDTIYNGASDNASGAAQLLAIADAFASLPEKPRRSILIALVGAEEQGLLGSLHYARHPTFPPGRIAANVNVDRSNIWGRTKDVSVIGPGKSSLEDLLVQAARTQDRVVVDEKFPDKGYYYRSDQFNFAKIGVPALYFRSGTDFRDRPAGWGEEQVERWISENYHQPSDELDDGWDFGGMIEDARLAFLVGLAAANADAMPTWTPGDEFEAVRKEALAAVASE